MIRAGNIVLQKGYALCLVFCGDGPLRKEAETEVEQLGMNDHVRFVGQIPEFRMREYYANATMLAFPTYHQEGFPMVVFQSVAAGIPVITTRIRAAADYLSEPENCLWVWPRNPEQLAGKMIHLIQNPDLCARVGHCNRKLARQFTSSIVAEEFLSLYGQIRAHTN